MNAIENYIKIAERFSLALPLHRARDSRIAEDIAAAHLQDEQGVEALMEKVLENQRSLFKIRNELDAATEPAVNALKQAGLDATSIRRTTQAAWEGWHNARRFQDEWFTCKAILKTSQAVELGVSLADVGLAMEFSEEGLADFVKRFAKSKKITAIEIGNCPNDGRKGLYRLFDILKNLQDFSPLGEAEKKRIIKHLRQVQRAPKKMPHK